MRRPCGSLPVDDAHAKENNVWKFVGVGVADAVGVGVGTAGSKESVSRSPLLGVGVGVQVAVGAAGSKMISASGKLMLNFALVID